MKFETEVAALQKTPMFQGVDASRLRLLAFMGEDRRFNDGEYVVRQGDVSDSAYLILEGKADVIVEVNGKATVVATLGDSEVFGEMAMLCETPRTASVRARGELRTLMFEREGMLRLLREFPEMAVEMARSLAHRLERTTAELARLRAKCPPSEPS
ncbi:cyclic nucleotide-binding domain-containing protein [Oceanicella actignis]|uniref:Cyclic nucleotide-binding domain-containing protein n=1 Tax=Oceanicella actignis TaxID=1189325 RepID=A0A1M7T1R4_9RHOB|nr:cyclic nucleotide-binding domain-containing protein [Oceanicella actignis]SET37896.1 Cyclic nucleotide-binding domain-containing protein [Oceanicella actignis]SHN64614.1 Cyclic nucleotide-binding domain-containing protein [Oceanicella actignis]